MLSAEIFTWLAKHLQIHGKTKGCLHELKTIIQLGLFFYFFIFFYLARKPYEIPSTYQSSQQDKYSRCPKISYTLFQTFSAENFFKCLFYKI